MKFHVFGSSENPKLILIHGIQTPWQIWKPQIDYFQKDYLVIVPALDGHEAEQKSDYQSLTNEAEKIEEYCRENSYHEIFAVCGLSMGGAIAFKLWENGKLAIHYLILDGAPLVPYNKYLATIMTKQYINITHKSQQREKKTLDNFTNFFLPEKYLDEYLRIADNMTDDSIRNMVGSLSCNQMLSPIENAGGNILYMHGSKVNELLSKKSAKQLKRYYPKTKIIIFKGYAHCYKAIYEPEQWIEIVEAFITT